MSDTLGRYHFLSWARQGIGAAVSNPDQGALPARASLDVQLTVKADGAVAAQQPGPVTAQTFGPGDVVGIDPRQIIRTEPRPFTSNFEPNYLCGIEFDAPDFPWLFTPAGAKNDRLRPWVALIALKSDEFQRSALAPKPLPVIEVQSATALQDLSESWNWAHTQISGDAPLAEAATASPGNVISRLLCPRRLDPETAYTAFLVPAFETGRLAGLGQNVSSATTTEGAWSTPAAVPVSLPVYYEFQFHTSDAGDFESLVRRLTARVLDASVGQRLMDVSQPMRDVPSAGPPLGLEGALDSLTTQPTPWHDPQKTAFQTKVQQFVNQTAAVDDDPAHPLPNDPVIAPPIYGRWHAAVTSVNRTAAGWVNELNLDPRNRSAAGMGTQVAQTERTQLLASAWQQVEGVLKANQLLRQAQLARLTLLRIHSRRFGSATPEAVMTLTAPLHARVLASPGTIRAAVGSSLVPPRMLSGAFRRATRSRRRIGAVAANPTALLNAVNTGAAVFKPLPKPPAGMISIERVSAAVKASGGWGGGKPPALSTFTPSEVAAIPPRPNFRITPAGVFAAATQPGALDKTPEVAFRLAALEMFTFIQARTTDAPPPPALDAGALSSSLLEQLNPATTVPRRAHSLISIPVRTQRKTPDPLETIMAAPEFPQPMYAPLRDLNPQFLLEGVDQILPDTVGLLLQNRTFIEAYMAGLNHEMARQLLFNGYPTDQRGSYFRQFWDVSAYVRQPSDPSNPEVLAELLKDIPPEHLWDKNLGLGAHPNRTDVPQDSVVLLVRGELFKRYPNAIVYAGKAVRQGNTRVLDESDERYPIFRGTLPDDITFLGFNLSREDARGGTAASPEGFFFVFQEQPSEPRFGLEPTERSNVTTSWSDLAWTNFTGSNGGGGQPVFQLPDLGNTTRGLTLKNSPWRLASQAFQFVVSGAPVPGFLSPNQQPVRVAIAASADDAADPDNHWGLNSAQTAYILLRTPFRILMHASLVLPPE